MVWNDNYFQDIWLIVCLIGLFIGIYILWIYSKIRRMKYQWRLSQFQLEMVIDYSKHFLILVDCHGYVKLCNNVALESLNKKFSEIKRCYIWEILESSKHKEKQKAFKHCFFRAIDHQQTVVFESFNSLFNSIDDMGIEFEIIPYFKEQQHGFVLISSLHITHTDNKQYKIQALNEQLELKVDERTKELKKTNNELKNTLIELKETQKHLIHAEKMASMGDLVAGVAHEINTPVGMSLTGITHLLEITENLDSLYQKEEMAQDDFEIYLRDCKQLSKSINTNLIKAADLIRSFKKVAVDQYSEVKRVFNVEEYFNEILLSLHHVIKKSRHNIKIQSPDDIVISSYPGAFSQIITNLIMNSFIHAFKFKEQGHILLEAQVDNNMLFITYTDDGQGIKQENLPRIFDPFFTTNREHGGSGLGLNIIFNIVNTTLNGKIECSSMENVGVEFKIVIPLEVNK